MADPAAGPAWASEDLTEDQDQAAFKLLYAGTADKAMMLELEADEVRAVMDSPCVNSLCVNSPCVNSPCVNSPCVNSLCVNSPCVNNAIA